MWRRSSYCHVNGDCAEVGQEAGGAVLVRDSTDPGGPVIRLRPEQWAALKEKIMGEG